MSECPICFKKANYITSCNHAFCKKCLYRWKHTCPLCRAHIELEYPNTRAMDRSTLVVKTISRMSANISIAVLPQDKLNLAAKLLNFVWDNRIVIRKNGYACRTIHKRSLLLTRQCKNMGLSPPKILKKILTI